MDKQTEEWKDLQMAKWTERLNIYIYIPETLCMPYVWLKPFQKEKYNNRIQTYYYVLRPLECSLSQVSDKVVMVIC